MGFARPLSGNAGLLCLGGAFDLPGSDIMDELLRTYVQYNYAYLPVLSMVDLAGILRGGHKHCSKMSLLLVQAMCFSASAHIDMSALRRARFRSRSEARDTFARRTEVRSLFPLWLFLGPFAENV